jgi:hypothetical protein
MPTILALRRLRQEGQEFEASLGYKVRPCLKKPKQRKQTPTMKHCLAHGGYSVKVRCECWVLDFRRIRVMRQKARS